MKRLFSKNKSERRAVRHDRIRARVLGTTEAPRLSVFRGLKNMTLQVIDDSTGKTLCQATSTEARKGKEKVEGRKAKIADAYLTGKLLAERAKEKKIEKVVFDRGGYSYHGRVAAAADGARDNGLKF